MAAQSNLMRTLRAPDRLHRGNVLSAVARLHRHRLDPGAFTRSADGYAITVNAAVLYPLDVHVQGLR